MALWETIAGTISEITGEPFRVEEQQGIGGGCINSAYRIGGGGRTYFVKLNDARRLAMFEAESDGLLELAESGAIRVPRPICSGAADDRSFLVLEELRLGGGGDMACFGRQLAEMHGHTCERFGWFRDNTIGETPQSNVPDDSWSDFWGEQRLGPQLELAGARFLRTAEPLLERLPEFFADYRPVPSLLHGDLWSGNYAFTREGEAVLFDPAVYYGDREADIAMTELFGGFGATFYDAYAEAWPLDPGYAVRRTLYNLYHVLNHYNMFGGGYGAQAQTMIERLRAELG